MPARPPPPAKRIGRQGIVARDQGGAADVLASQPQLVPESLGDHFQHAHGLVGHFRPNAIARQDGELQEHWAIVPKQIRK